MHLVRSFLTLLLTCRQLGPVVRSIDAAAGADGNGLAISLLEGFIDYNAALAPALKQLGRAPATGATPLRPIFTSEGLAGHG